MNKRLIKLYKGVFLEDLHTFITQKGTVMSKCELDNLMKYRCDLNKSTTKMSTEELTQLAYECIDFGDSIGCKLNFPDNEYTPVYDEEM